MDDTRVGSAKPILIEENVWLGYGAIVLKGVTIGKNSIIGAGSVVTTNIPANCIAAGNPCRVIKQHD
jgi:maltose O-acetyltransferase